MANVTFKMPDKGQQEKSRSYVNRQHLRLWSFASLCLVHKQSPMVECVVEKDTLLEVSALPPTQGGHRTEEKTLLIVQLLVFSVAPFRIDENKN